MTHINLNDWVFLALALIGALGTLARANRLPEPLRTCLKHISANEVLEAIAKAEAMRELTSSQRRDAVASYIQKFCLAKTGVKIPRSIANFTVEYVYQQWKRIQTKHNS